MCKIRTELRLSFDQIVDAGHDHLFDVAGLPFVVNNRLKRSDTSYRIGLTSIPR